MKQLLTLLLFFASCSLTLTAQRIVRVEGLYNDVVYVPARQELYAVRPAAAASGNVVSQIDPATGAVLADYFVGSDPSTVVATTSGRYLYIGFNGENRVRRFDLNSKQVDLEFSLGGEDDSLGPFYAEEIVPLRGSDDVVAISRRNTCCSPRHEGVAVFDRGQLRSETTPDHTGSNTITYTDVDDVLIGYNNETTDFALRRMPINAQGVTVSKEYYGFDGFGVRIEYADGRIYATNGQVATLDNGVPTLAGRANTGELNSYGEVALEAVPGTNRVYYLGASNDRYALVEVDATTLTLVSSTPFNLSSLPGYQGTDPYRLIGLGSPDAFAYMLRDGQLGLLTLCTSAVTTAPPAYTGLTNICYGAELTLSVPADLTTGGQTIVWSTNQTGDTITVTEPGTYSYRIADATGCPGPASPDFYVDQEYYRQSGPYIATPRSTVLCAGGSLTLSSEYSDDQLVWSTGEVGRSLTVDQAGEYSAYRINPDNGCPTESSTPISITESQDSAPPAPIMLGGTLIDTCTRETITLYAEAPDSLTLYWELPNIGSGEGRAFFVYPYFSSTQEFSVVSASANGCTSSPTTGSVTFHTPPLQPYLQYNLATNTLASTGEGPILWYYQDVLEAETAGRFYQPKNDGFYSARAKDEFCVSESSNLVSVAGTTATQDELLSSQLQLYPNPVSERIYLRFDPGLLTLLGSRPVTYQLSSASGQLLRTGTVLATPAGTDLPVADLSSGLYVLTLATPERAILRKRVSVVR